MPTYNPFIVEGHRSGLNLRSTPHALAPGECVSADNIDFSQNSIRKRNGTFPVMRANVDNAIKGPAPGTSCYVHGSDHGIEHLAAVTESYGTDTNIDGIGRSYPRFDFNHHRQGCIVIAGDDMDTIQSLNPMTGVAVWAVEFLLWTDQIPFLKTDKNMANPAQINFHQVIAAKSFGANYRWELVALPDTTSVNRVHLALAIYTGGAVGSPNLFFYSQGTERAWLEPGKKTWISFIWDGVDKIRTKYWQDGLGTVLDSDQVVPGPLLAAGNGTATPCPIVIGRRANLKNTDTGTRFRELGWNGCVTEMRFWDAQLTGGNLPARWGIVSSDPPASNDWYVDRELEDFQLSTIDDDTAASFDLKLVYQFKHDRVGTTNVGVELPDEQTRMIRARYRNPAAPADQAAAWLTGADATWLPGEGALGKNALGIVPGGVVTAEEECYLNGLKNTVANYVGHKSFIGGVRIPNGWAYLTTQTDNAASTTTALVWPRGFTVRGSWRLKGLSSDTADTFVLWQMCSVRKGIVGGGIFKSDYSVNPVLELAIAYNAGWKFRWTVLDAAGVPTNVWGSTALTIGDSYTVMVTTRWETVAGANLRTTVLYVNGAQDATDSAAATKPFLSEPTDGEIPTFTDDNTNAADGRDYCYPMSIGFSCATAPFAIATPVAPFSMRFGAQNGDLASSFGGTRTYWAWHNDKTRKGPNDGVPYRGEAAFIGDVGDLEIWNSCLSESHARAMADRPPTSSEVIQYGSSLLSYWKFDEGSGCVAKDSGTLRNHIRFNPLPLVGFQTGAIRRTTRPPVTGLWQLRKGGVNASLSPKKGVYALAGGNVHEMQTAENGDTYLESIGRCATPELYTPLQLTPRLPTSFQFNEMLYLCTGFGPVKRITNGQLYDAGMTPVFGNIGDDQTNPGWREFDRDGTFTVIGWNAAAANETVFQTGSVYSWMVTFYDPIAGIESAPSRIMSFQAKNNAGGTDYGWKAATLSYLPHSPQPNATKYRIYRTTTDGTQMLFLAEVDAGLSYADSNTDFKLGSVATSWLNYPPPQGARLGIAFGARAIYSGVQEDPGTIFFSLLGQPGACPPQYRITLPDEVTALFPLNDRVLVCTRRAIYALFDTGSDISFQGLEQPPIQLSELRKDIGCLGHHTGVLIESIGWVFLGERGLYATDGQSFRYISERVEPLFRTMDLSRAHAFVGFANKKRDQYVLMFSDQCFGDGRNDKALVWDYGRDAYSTMTDIMAVNAAIVEDQDTGVDRIWLTDWSGQVFEFDPPDQEVTKGGLLSGPLTGTVIATKLDTLGSGKYTRFFITENEDLPTDGAGLRGVRINIVNGNVPWNEIPMLIVANDSGTVEVESLNAQVTDPTGYTFQLGAYGGEWKAPMNFGGDASLKIASRAVLKYGASGGETLTATAKWDESPDQNYTMTPTRSFDPISPILGRGRNLEVTVTDKSAGAPSGVAANPFEVTAVEIDWRQRGRSSYVGS